MTKPAVIPIAIVLTAVSASAAARANNATWTFPYAGSGNQSGALFTVVNEFPTVLSGTAIQGWSDSGATGVAGHSGQGAGVSGDSTSNAGVAASSGSSWGVYAYTSSVDHPAVFGQALNGANSGVYGATGGPGYGVKGTNTTGPGVYGDSQTGNGLLGQNNRTDFGAAAVQAIAGSSAGLAYYGLGSMELTGGLVIGGSHSANPGEAWKTGSSMWSTFSDERVKKDVKSFEQGLAQLKRVRPVSFKYNGLGGTADDGKEHVGVIAQELEKVLPAMVVPTRAKLHAGDAQETEIKGVDPSDFIYVLINSVQEQQKIIERQDARIANLEREHAPVLSSLVSGSLGGLALGLVPLGLVATHRRRKADER